MMNSSPPYSESPTVFHITHWKAGSQWLHRILLEAIPERIVSPLIDEKQFLEMPLKRGAVYPTLYVTKEQFHSVELPIPYRKVVIIRDLRDTLISGYFSIRYSHPVNDSRLADWRSRANSMTVESGLLMLMNEWLPASAEIQRSWIASGEEIIRYEDLLDRDLEILESVLINSCDISISSTRLREIIVNNRFENLTGNRKRGEESLTAHERKGIVGDWQNYFTPRVVDGFNDRFGELLVRAGYG